MQPTELLNLMKSRRSIRNYKKEPVSDDQIKILLEAAQWTQSASNRQPWRFIVIKDNEILSKISKYAIYGRFIKEAPVAIAIVADKKIAPKWYIHDTSMASHQICLMVSALGLGTCWIGSLDREKCAEILNLKENEYLTTILPIGVPKLIPKPTSRKDLDLITSYM